MGIIIREHLKKVYKDYEMKVRITKHTVKRKKLIKQFNEFKEFFSFIDFNG